jgi:hypothetical protein
MNTSRLGGIRVIAPWVSLGERAALSTGPD